MKHLIEQTRVNFGASPRSFSMLKKLYNRVSTFDDRFDTLSKDLPHLYSNGTVVWAYIIQANSELFEKTSGTCPAVVVYSTDPYFDGNLKELRAVAEQLYALKDQEGMEEDLQKFASVISDEMSCMLNMLVPKSLTSGRAVYYTSIMVFRKHLPQKFLRHGWFPLLVSPRKTRSSMILPSKYWSDRMIDMWSRD